MICSTPIRIILVLFIIFSFSFVFSQSKGEKIVDTFFLIRFDKNANNDSPLYRVPQPSRNSFPRIIQQEIIIEGRRIHIVTEFVEP